MNNKGFTIVELIAIIVVLAAIFLVSFPYLLNTTKTDKEKQYNEMVNNLCLAGKSYIYANMDKFPTLSTIGSSIEIKISELIEYGNVNKNEVNPKTDELIKNKSLTYKVLSDLSLDCKYNE